MQIQSKSAIASAAGLGAMAGRQAARAVSAAEVVRPLSRDAILCHPGSRQPAARQVDLQGKVPLSMAARERLMAQANFATAAGGTMLAAATVSGGVAFASMGTAASGTLSAIGRPAAVFAVAAAVGGALLFAQSHSLLKTAKQP